MSVTLASPAPFFWPSMNSLNPSIVAWRTLDIEPDRSNIIAIVLKSVFIPFSCVLQTWWMGEDSNLYVPPGHHRVYSTSRFPTPVPIRIAQPVYSALFGRYWLATGVLWLLPATG